MGKININLKEILIFVCILIFMYIIYKSITYYKYKNSLNKTLNKNINNDDDDDYDDHTVLPGPTQVLVPTLTKRCIIYVKRNYQLM